jgi:hypothetical protein
MSKEQIEKKLYSLLFTQVENIDLNASNEIKEWDIQQIEQLLEKYAVYFTNNYDFMTSYATLMQSAKAEYYRNEKGWWE